MAISVGDVLEELLVLLPIVEKAVADEKAAKSVLEHVKAAEPALEALAAFVDKIHPPAPPAA